MKISQAYHPLIGILEVVLRNRINTILIAHFSDPDWIINQKTGFMSDRSLTYLDRRTGRIITNDFLKCEVEKAEKRLRRTGVPITSGRVIAELMLGFWTDLFEVNQYRLLSGRPIQIFNHLPVGHGRKEVADLLNKIRLFRNRINHNEPICFSGSDIDFMQAEEIHLAIYNILDWIDPELTIWIKDLDTVKIKISRGKTI